MSFFPSLFGQHKNDPVTSLRSRIDNLFDDFFKDWPQQSDLAGKWMRPAVDMAETKEGLEIKIDLPDMDKKDIHLHLHGDQLTVEGEKEFKHEDKTDKGYHLLERSYGSFRRDIPLPFALEDSSKVTARYDKGVLSILIPRPAGAVQDKRRINIG
ncbi:Hsp20/alpha crystallin family protein [Aliiglaciecola sp. CAU 1673]|uniref:Hsp20/alpha crystallin family protein n=1 Tax=Aliiglaciecola sp. CAU 1673 TaxID=3032595 RepID=UPI0023DA52B8|nr:Hsp20/alpha crystallin family protein [Aliiglaciecola sp. CAU 1673]MDF2178725.1 Hsp20/alpha crystallin family protein [Aliiglaciecola sp. CAU 1673]